MSRAILEAPMIRPPLPPNRRCRQRDVDALAVCAAAHGFKMANGLAVLKARDDFLFLGQSFGRDNQRDWFADRLGCRKAEDARGALIPGHNASIQIQTYDPIVG